MFVKHGFMRDQTARHLLGETKFDADGIADVTPEVGEYLVTGNFGLAKIVEVDAEGNPVAAQVPPTGEPTLDSMTVAQLKAMAEARGIAIEANAKKARILELLQAQTPEP